MSVLMSIFVLIKSTFGLKNSCLQSILAFVVAVKRVLARLENFIMSKLLVFTTYFIIFCNYLAAMDIAIQKCKGVGYWCNSSMECAKPKENRCTEKQSKDCKNTTIDDNCLYVYNTPNSQKSGIKPGWFKFKKWRSPLSSSLFSSSRKRRSKVDVEKREHEFIQYRGFAYEFANVGHQQLDLNDPDYKYDPAKWKKDELYEIDEGQSKCTYQEVQLFIANYKMVRGAYVAGVWCYLTGWDWLCDKVNNCQTYARLMQRFLQTCNPTVNKNDRKKRDKSETALKTEEHVCCCDDRFLDTNVDVTCSMTNCYYLNEDLTRDDSKTNYSCLCDVCT